MQSLACLRRISHERMELRSATLEQRVDVDEVAPIEIDVSECNLEQVAHRVQLAARDHVVARRVLLEHQPHRAYSVARIAPISFAAEVAEGESFLEPE